MGAQVWLAAGAVAGAVGVILGAFGAHALRGRLPEAAIATWQTAVAYQFTHALALIAVGMLLRQGGASARALLVAGAAFCLGTVFFSGSLYGLALGGPRWLGPITPLGGAAFLVGWVALLVAVLRVPGDV